MLLEAGDFDMRGFEIARSGVLTLTAAHMWTFQDKQTSSVPTVFGSLARTIWWSFL